MNQGLRIVVADDEVIMRNYLQKILPRLGHQVVGTAENGRELVELCHAAHSDLVITDIRMPELDGIDAADEIYRKEAIPVILVSAHHDTDSIARAEANHVMAYLVKPIKQADMEPAIALAMRRFSQFQDLRNEAANLAEALEHRKLVEEAKAKLMTAEQIGEHEAFERMQQAARDRQLRLVEIARDIVGQKDKP